MNIRSFLFFFAVLFLLNSSSFSLNFENGFSSNFAVFKLEREPLIRIGLATNAGSATITTSDSQLIATSPDEPDKFLGTQQVRILARSYSPPEIEIFNFEIAKITTREEAVNLEKDAREATEIDTSLRLDAKANTWSVLINAKMETPEEAEQFKKVLSDKGFGDVQIVSSKFTKHTDEALKLSAQIAKSPKSEVRSLPSSRPVADKISQNPVLKTSSSVPTNIAVNPNLREVLVSGASAVSKFSSLKAVAFGSQNERAVPVKYNGKAYRGKIEVFVNSRGTLTVVNVVPLEEYLLGVVPSELSLPQLEAQKAQAVAARTYAVANINNYGKQGFDMLPTVWSQVYKGVSIETKMGTQAVLQTRGIVATYHGTPINALYTSTCGGRTENSENIFDFDEPYLRGVNCSLEGDRHFQPFLIKSTREIAKIRNEANNELVRLAAKYAVNNFLMITNKFDDDYFEDQPTEIELRSWLNQLAIRFNKPLPQLITKDTSQPLLLAKALSEIIYTDAAQTEANLMSESDVNYQLSFDDADQVPKLFRPTLAMLLRDGWFSIYSDLTIKPQKHYSRAKILHLIDHIYDQKKWTQNLETGVAKPTDDGKLILKSGRSEKEIVVSPNVFLFRQFGDAFYQVKEAALLGGENVRYKTDASGAVVFLEIEPTEETTVAEKMSPFTYWNASMSASTMRARLGRYVKGLGTLIDVRIAKEGFSRRATDLEIITTNGTQHLTGGKIRSALRLKEQLFVMNKRYGSDGRISSVSFTGRGWGHGVGMCQYGAYGLAKMGVKYDEIVKHYYTGIDLTKAY